jgi:phage/plasmid-like protein (TIGR03299 family)
MGHDIDFSTGKPAIAYVGETPWHGLGEELPRGQPIETWLKAAKLDWELKRLPVQYLVEGKLRTMDDRFVLVRSDTSAALSVVSPDYQIVQPKEVLGFFRDLVEEFGYSLETAGALNGGRKFWALAKTGRTAAVGGNGKDELAAYVLLATSCDKTLATTAAFTSVRVVCQNTLFFAMDDVRKRKRPAKKVSHNFHFDSTQVKKDLGLIDAAWSAFMEQAAKMAAHRMETKEAASFFETLLVPAISKPLTQKSLREHEALMGLFTAAPGQDLVTAKGTLWGAINATTYYVDHVRKKSAGDRLDSSWFGVGAALKDKAWVTATNLLDSRN